MDFFTALGKVITYIGVPAAILFAIVFFAYIIFERFAKKRVDHYFSEQLEKFRHAQEMEMRKFQNEIDSSFNRITKIHEKEIEVLPALWHKFHDATGAVGHLTSLMRSYPNLDGMSEDAFQYQVENSDLLPYQKKELLALSQGSRNNYYIEKTFFLDLFDANKLFDEFHNYFIKNRIFLDEDLKNEFIKADAILLDAISLKKEGKQARDGNMGTDAYKLIRDEIPPVRERIEQLVQKRLRFMEA